MATVVPASRIVNGLRSAAYLGWFLLAMMTPLVVNLWGQQPFDLPKTVLVRSLVWLLAGLILAETLLARRALRSLVHGNPLAGSVGLLALVIGVTTATAADWRLSLWGSYDRAQGGLTLFAYLLLFLLAAHHLRPLRLARQLLQATAVVGVPLALLGFAQAMGWNPFGLVTDARSPIYATLGRANFVGAYLAILAPLALALSLTSRRRRWRAAWTLLFLAECLLIGLTSARSAWLGASVALVLFALLWRGHRIRRGLRRLTWCVLGLLVVAGPLSVLVPGPHQAGSVAARHAIWQGTLALIQERPYLGYGADALGLVFPTVYPPQLVYTQGRAFTVDRAHNWILDWTVTTGLAGLLAYLLLVIHFLFVVGRALERPCRAKRRLLLIAVLAAWTGNMANNLTSFDVTATATASWLLMGVGIALSRPISRTQQARGEDIGVQPLRLALLAAIGVLVGGAVLQLNGRPLLADMAVRRAHLASLSGGGSQGIEAAREAVALWPVEPAHHMLLGQLAWQQTAVDPAHADAWLVEAERALASARHLRPQGLPVWLQTADLYRAAALRLGLDTRTRAHEAYRRARSLAPYDATVLTAWARTYLEENRPEAAAVLLREAVLLDASSGEAYLLLGEAEAALGRIEYALADFRQAVRLLPASSRAYAGLADSYRRLGHRAEALQAVEAALARDPLNSRADHVRRLLEGGEP